ncbi:helix-hairpin-helix domain-containing protein [Ideonella sp. B7]|uniref:helix-hairpin-helix domain-containing protein n=1 Tax=Ideonella benzenivorans TaxID=2831643 RepID=UPI001CEC0FC1|nr:helix-hairpin-helix domain-containing protein [Ideonella benzenivorans]MCA6216228.1 helix-hairpin-helix domain-containing protein [Ideonella benzenivorans]
MSPNKVDRTKVRKLTDLPNVGKAMAEDLRLLGFSSPEQIAGACPFEMYHRLGVITAMRHDPCVMDVFMSITTFLNGGPSRPWWEFTEARKAAGLGTVEK